MTRLMFAVLVVTAAAAFAQDTEETTTTVQMPGMPGMNMKVKVKTTTTTQRSGTDAPPPAPAQPPARTFGGENFQIDYSPMGVPSSTIKVLSPEGANAQVFSDDGNFEGTFSVPFNLKGRGDTYYRIILTGPDGSLILDKKYEVKTFLGGTLKVRGAAPAPAPAPAPVPVAQPVAAGMPDADFQALVAAVNDASFGSEKLGVVETAAESHVFTIEQVGTLVGLMSMSSEQVGVVERLKNKIVDRQNSFKLLERFTFSSDKEKVRKLLK